MAWSVAGCNHPFYHERHAAFIEKVQHDNDSLEHLMSDYIRMGGAFWGLAAQDIMGCLNVSSPEYEMKKKAALAFVRSCWDCNAGAYVAQSRARGSLHAQYAVLIHAIFHALDELPKDAIVHWIRQLQLPNGSFRGDMEGETDGRFVYCAACILSLLKRLDAIDNVKALEWIEACQNADGAFGSIPGSESHAAYTFCCVAALALLGGLHIVNKDRLGSWLVERQIAGSCGGFNGRPEKAPDVCYSWWILSSLTIIDRAHWVNRAALTNFILTCQDEEDGGIADRPNDMPDVFHTFFGTAGLSLLRVIPQLREIHPVYSLCYDHLD